MSDLILPAGITLPSRIQPKETVDETASDEDKAKAIPTAVGWKILCVVPDVADTYENSSIIKADAYMKQEEHATTVLFVLDVGPDAYGDKTKFPNGAWCKRRLRTGAHVFGYPL